MKGYEIGKRYNTTKNWIARGSEITYEIMIKYKNHCTVIMYDRGIKTKKKFTGVPYDCLIGI